MRELAPMIRLDLATLVSRRTGVALGVFLAAFIGIGGSDAAPAMPAGIAFIAIFLALGPATADRAYGLTRLYASLPLRRRTVITGHYAVALGLFAAAAVLAGVLGVALPAVGGGSRADVAFTGVATVGGASLAAAAMLPLIVRFGPRAASLAWLVILLGGLGIGSLIRTSGPANAWWPSSLQVLTAQPALVLGLGAILLVGVWGASYLASSRLYERLEV